MSFASKRPFASNASEPNRRGKWRKTAASTSQQTPLKTAPGAVVFRILCPVSKSGIIIGKGGCNVARIHEETGAKVKIEEIVAGCDEQVVVITGSYKDAEVKNEQTKEGVKDADVADGDQDDKTGGENDEEKEKEEEKVKEKEEEKVKEKDEEKEKEKEKEKEDSSVLEDSKSQKLPSSVQKALLIVFERIVEGEADEGGDEDKESKESNISVRLLIMPSQVGCLLGKGGSIIKQMNSDSGAQIRVLLKDKIPACASAHDEIVQLPFDRISPAQDGVIRVQHRIAMGVPDGNENVISRLIVSSHQTGCLLGKGGAVISEIRKLSGAQIRTLSKEQLPNSVPDNDEVIQVTGNLRAVQDALLLITDKLKGLLFRDKVPGMDHARHPTFLDQMPPFGTFMGMREPSPPRMFSNLPPFQKDIVVHPHEERSAFAHAMNCPGIPHGFERIPPVPWGPQVREGGGGSMPMPNYPGGGLQRRIGGFPGGNHTAVITSTTVDVVVPRALVPSIYGEDGGCLKRIREISEAKITITEPRPEAAETVIIISGTPEQTNAAQSLIQAFVLSETAAT